MAPNVATEDVDEGFEDETNGHLDLGDDIELDAVPIDSSQPHPLVIGSSSDPYTFYPQAFAGTHLAVDAAGAAHAAMKEQFEILMERSPFLRTYVAILRPWRDFFTNVSFPDDVHEVMHRSRVNFLYFGANYALLVLLLFIFVLLSHPVRLLFTGAVATAWIALAHFGSFDPDWKPQVGDFTILAQHRALLCCAIAAASSYLVVGELILELIGLSAVCVLGHTVLHPIVEEGAAYTAVPTMPMSGAPHFRSSELSPSRAMDHTCDSVL